MSIRDALAFQDMQHQLAALTERKHWLWKLNA